MRVPRRLVRGGTRAGIDTGPDERVDRAWQAKTDRNPLEEHGVLGTRQTACQGNQDGELYSFSARYGPSTLDARLRSQHRFDHEPRHRKSPCRAGAKCPGDTERARLSVAPYGFASSHDKKSATAAFKAFVRRAVERHGCGDLCLPA